VKPLDREHPTDERLLALYFDEGSAPLQDEELAVRQHLHGCEACTWRYTALTAPLQQLRQDAASEADEVFTPGRLAAQRAAIRHRLEQGKGTPRVVAFPGAQPSRPRLVHRPAARWMAAAAAAGLLIGVSAGRLIHVDSGTPAATARAARPAEPPRLAATRHPAPSMQALPAATEPEVTELNLLSGIDSAVSRPHVAELYALDELTPHPAEMLMARAVTGR